ncbi:DUF4097 family beta strand repeat-containing protein [Streptomyces koyangensis]|uniref:DUF4097 family beta strand repeat-containing protein n=1 Tax=Streptomyces TaxID=1883 RepID=UPI00337174FE
MTVTNYTATAPGAVWAALNVPVGAVTVTVDPTLVHAEVTVRTPDEEGPVADAVRKTVIRETTAGIHQVLSVEVPTVQGGASFGGGGWSATTMSVNGQSISFSGPGMQVFEGDVFIGGQKIVAGGRVVAEKGTVVSGTGAATPGGITLDVRLPGASSVSWTTTSANLTVVGDDLHVLEVSSVSGDISARGVHTLSGTSVSGDIDVQRVVGRLAVETTSGGIAVDRYSGSDAQVRSVSGYVVITGTPAATAQVVITTVSGDISARGLAHLAPQVQTVSGDIY